MLDVVSHTPPETEGLTAWQDTGFVDAVRHFVPADQKLYTWWSYRNRDWRASDRGRRLDHVWVTPDLVGKLKRQIVLKDARDWPQGSDHVPVCVETARSDGRPTRNAAPAAALSSSTGAPPSAATDRAAR